MSAEPLGVSEGSTPGIGSEGQSRRRFLRRAAVAGAVGRTVPTILTMSPAGAVGSCTLTLDWDTFTVGTVFTSTTISGVTVSLTVVPIAAPPTTLLATNRTIRAAPNGSFPQQVLQFQMLPNATGIGQTITFSFSSSVQTVKFSFYDIDNLTGGWGDRIQMNTAGYTSTFPAGTTVIDAGAAGNLFRNSQVSNNLNANSNQGNPGISYAGPISSFQFVYSNAANTGGGNQRIGISDITFDKC